MKKNTRREPRAGWALLGAGVLLLSLLMPAFAEEPKPGEPSALLTGTVFTHQGFALPGVKVTVTRKGDDEPEWENVSDRRGEFAFRLPAGAATYQVRTHAENRKNETRTVKFQAQEKINLFFRLPLATEDEKKAEEEDKED